MSAEKSNAQNAVSEEDFDDYWLSPEFEAMAYASLVEGDEEYMRMREEMAEDDLPLEWGIHQLDLDEHSGESPADVGVVA